VIVSESSEHAPEHSSNPTAGEGSLPPAAQKPGAVDCDGTNSAEQSASAFPRPAASCTAEDIPRCVGFELEFSGITLDDASRRICEALGGRRELRSSAEHRVVSARLGEFNVEVDWKFLKDQARASAEKGGGDEWTTALRDLATAIVPLELVCPPIPIGQLHELDPLIAALREGGAKGTATSPLAAYGVHINTEIPSLDATTLHRFLRAYCLLQWWLVHEHDPDTTRRLSFYIEPYPEAYLHEVMELSAPSLEQMLDHYLEHNATRNRALDLLPMFATINEERVQAAVDDGRVKSRPAFHYRLPDCHIEDPEWSLRIPWQRWLIVEALADDEAAQDELAEEFLSARRPVFGVNKDKWRKRIESWLHDRGLA